MTSVLAAPKVSPKVLAWARTSSGLSLTEAAKRLAVDPSRINAWEVGRETPSISKLEGLADAYHRPVAVFLLDGPPQEAPSPPDLRVIPEDHDGSPFSEKTLLAIRKARRVRDVASELLPQLDERALSRLQRAVANLPADRAAAEIAASTGAYTGEPPRFSSAYQALSRWRSLIEEIGVLVLQLPMPIEDARGFSLGDGQPPVVVVNQSDAPRARVFTLFHEMAHVLRRTEGVCDLGGGELDGRSPPLETWCNAFAGAFLVPSAHLRSEFRPWPKGEDPAEDEVRRLSSRYQVSETVVLRRLLTLGVIDSTQYRTLVSIRKPASRRGRRSDSREVRRNIPVERLAEYGVPFVSMVVKSAYEGRIALGDVADILDIRLKHLPAILDRTAAASPRA